MEFEVLNDILTSTVASLFTSSNVNATPAYKTSSQLGQDKSEIPRRSSFHEDLQQSMTENPVTQWLLTEAKQKYQKAINTLHLDNSKLQGRHLLTQSIPDLANEKKKVKNELKVYDLAFQTKFSRIPSRSEKEPMRNLYMYYKRLKQAIVKIQAQPNTQGQRSASANSAGSGTSGMSGVSANSENSGNAQQSNNPSGQEEKAQIKQGISKTTNPEEKPKQQSLSDFLNDADPNQGMTEAQQLAEFMKKYNFKTQAEAMLKLQQIRDERKMLRVKLDSFQKNFEQVHNRKIRYTKDIVSVQSEFKRYKDLKVDATQIEKFAKTLPK